MKQQWSHIGMSSANKHPVGKGGSLCHCWDIMNSIDDHWSSDTWRGMKANKQNNTSCSAVPPIKSQYCSLVVIRSLSLNKRGLYQVALAEDNILFVTKRRRPLTQAPIQSRIRRETCWELLCNYLNIPRMHSPDTIIDSNQRWHPRVDRFNPGI